MDIFRMECFIAAVDFGNLTRAAEYMNITQPTMSVQIRELEREVGFALLQRERNGVRPTAAGELLHDGFVRLVDGYHTLLDDVRTCAQGRSRLTIGYHGPTTWAGLPHFIARFSQKYPEIEIVLFQHQYKELVQSLELGVLDVIFSDPNEMTAHPRLETLPLFREKSCFALSPEHPLATQKSLTYPDICNETILMNNHPSASMDSIVDGLLSSGIERRKCRFFDQMEITLAMAASQQGIAALPRSFKTGNPALVYLDYDTDAVEIPHCLAWNRDDTNPAVRSFISECKQVQWPYRKTKIASD